jgi:hypothetical protein
MKLLVHATTLALLAGLLACSAETAGSGNLVRPETAVTPEVLDVEALIARLEPSGQEKAVIANFWATW